MNVAYSNLKFGARVDAPSHRLLNRHFVPDKVEISAGFCSAQRYFRSLSSWPLRSRQRYSHFHPTSNLKSDRLLGTTGPPRDDLHRQIKASLFNSDKSSSPGTPNGAALTEPIASLPSRISTLGQPSGVRTNRSPCCVRAWRCSAGGNCARPAK